MPSREGNTRFAVLRKKLTEIYLFLKKKFIFDAFLAHLALTKAFDSFATIHPLYDAN